MPLFDWDADLSEADRDALIEKFAQAVARRGLTTPALVFLELHKPLTFLAGQSLIAGSGFLAPLFGPQNVQKVAKLVESRENVERLIERLETLASPPTPPLKERGE
jgi:hypothetical protein